MEEIYDVLILGGGPAGLTAGIYCGRYNLKTLIVASSFGGTANLAGEVENWPGFVGSGMELMNNIKNQVEKFGADFLEAGVSNVVKDGGEFVLHYGDSLNSLNGDRSAGQVVRGKSLIVALGTEHRKLDIPGEKEFLGKGVSYCATCDGNFFKGKKVAVVGGADSAAKAALYLADICESVTVVYRKHEMRCEPVSLEKIKDRENISILYHSNPVEVIGKSVVSGLRVVTDDNGNKSERVLDVDGVFIEAGAVAATEVLEDLGVEMEKGYVVTGKDCKTNIEGVFAAGDVTDVAMRQMITAAGEGAVAAKGVHEFLMGK